MVGFAWTRISVSAVALSAAFSFAAMTLVACSESGSDCIPGSEGCECNEGQCLTGLVCLSDTCVDTGAGGGGGGGGVAGGGGGMAGNGGAAAACDPLLQNCPEQEEACFRNPDTGATTCATPVVDPGSGQQGDPCQFINQCQKGFGCEVADDPFDPTGSVCAYYCDASSGGGPSCADGPGPSFTCADLGGPQQGLGVCIDCSVFTDVPECQ